MILSIPLTRVVIPLKAVCKSETPSGTIGDNKLVDQGDEGRTRQYSRREAKSALVRLAEKRAR